jgi:hypothetical protein
MTERVFLSCVESCIAAVEGEAVTQAIQHLAISTFAKSIGGCITFYTAEDPLTLASQSLMRSTLQKQLPIDGVVFYRLKQFCHGGSFDFAFLQTILADGYEVHFAREHFSLRTGDDLAAKFSELYCYEMLQSGRDVVDRLAVEYS